MRFYSRTNSKTWNALEFIRLFSKHSFSLPRRTSHCIHSHWIFHEQVDVENSMYGSMHRSSRSISFFYDLEGFDIFVHRLNQKSGEIFPSQWAHPSTDEKHLWQTEDDAYYYCSRLNMIKVNGIVWCMRILHSQFLHSHKLKTAQDSILSSQWMPNINFVKMIAIEMVCLSRNGIPNVSLLHVLHRALLVFPSV